MKFLAPLFIGCGFVVAAFLALAISNLPGCRGVVQCLEWFVMAPDNWADLPLLVTILMLVGIGFILFWVVRYVVDVIRNRRR